MPPKKDEAALRADVRRHREWAQANLDMLRSRTGKGFQGKLRQTKDRHEHAIYNWLVRNRTRLQELPLLRKDLQALDSLVTSVAEPASPCPSSGGASIRLDKSSHIKSRGVQTEQASSPKTPGSSSNSEAPLSTRRRGLKRFRED